MLLGGEAEGRHEASAPSPEPAPVLEADNVVGKHRTLGRHRRDKANWFGGADDHSAGLSQAGVDLPDQGRQSETAELVVGNVGGDDPGGERQKSGLIGDLVAVACKMVGELQSNVCNKSGSVL